MADSTINFDTTNILGFLDERWSKTDAYIDSQNVLRIEPGGNIELTLEDNINFAFMYSKLVVTFYGEDLDSRNNFKSEPCIFINEVYKDSSSNIISKNITRSVGFNMYKRVSEDPPKYYDETTFKMANMPMHSYIIKIKNTHTKPLLIYNIELFSSIDVSEGQVNKYVTSINKSSTAEKIVIGVSPSDNSTLVSFGVYLQNSTNLLQFYPVYYNGNIIALDTNYGQMVSIDYFTDDGSHTPPDGEAGDDVIIVNPTS